MSSSTEDPTIGSDRLRLMAMLQVVRESMMRDRTAAIQELRRLSRIIRARFDEADELTIACECSLLEIDTKSMTSAERLRLLRELDERAAALPETNRERRSVANFVASALRRVDREAGIAAYRVELARREELYPPDHRAVRFARLNLCVALRSHGATPSQLHEAHGILKTEWRSRREAFGDENPFTWMAAHAYVHNALVAARIGHPLEAPEAIVAHAVAVVEARQRLNGARHRRTLFARISLAEAHGRAGQREQAIWALLALRAEADEVGIDEPARIPLLLMELLGESPDSEDRAAAADFGRQGREYLVPEYGIDHPWVVEVEKRVGQIAATVA